ncbi:MAG: PKD domain-containing protein, partial [Vicingaceae bacterium]
YSVTVTSGVSCTSVDQITVTVNPAPDADAGSDQTICEGESIALGGSPTSTAAGASFSWNNAGTLSSSTDPNPTANPTTTTTYTLTVTDGNGCTSTDQVTVTVNDLPNVDAGSDVSICNGGTTTLGGSPTGPAGSTYAWNNAGTLSSSTDPNPTANPSTTTTYTVTVTDGNGCSATDQVTVTVGSLPTTDAGLDQTICEGESATLGGSPTGPSGSTYQWSNGASLNDATAANPVATPISTTTYTVTVTDASGCSDTDQITITVEPIPNADAGADQTICDGESIQIGGAPTSTTAGATFAWSNAASLNDGTLANPIASPTITTIYTVTVTHPNGCIATDQLTVNVNALPTADAGADQTICAGTSTTLGGSPTGPGGATYQWDNGASLSSNSVSNPTATPLTTTIYSVTVTDGNGCSSIDQVQITVEPFPDVDAGVNQTICENESVVIGGSPTSSTAGATFAWDNAASLNDATSANPTASPIITTTYTVIVTGANGCTITDNMTVLVNPAPATDAGSDRDICIGESTNLGGSPTGPSGSTFAWNNASTLNDATIGNPTATPASTTTYTVTVTDANGCSNTDQLTITVNPLPTVDAGIDQTICNGEPATLGGSPTGPAGATYTWNNAASLNNANVANPVATPSSTTTYTVTVTDGSTACTETDQITITVLPLPDVDAGADQTICNLQAVTIGGSPTSTTTGATFAWSNAATLDDATLANPSANPTTTTTYTVTVTHPNGCTDTDQMTVNVNSLPLVDAGADQTICDGSSTTIGGSPTGPGGSTFAWDNAATLNDNTLANPTASPLVTTTYTVTVTDGNGCTAEDQILVTVVPNPDADAGSDQTICLNESIAIGGSPTSTVAGATFSWDNAATLNNATDPNPLASPTATTTYTVTVTHPNGCTATDQVVVNVDPLPVVDAGADQAICIGSSTTLGGSPTGPAGASYQWDNASTLNDATSANPTATPTVTTTYTVTVTDASTTCTNTDQITITVNPLPIVDAGLDQTICNGTTATLGGSPTGPSGSTYLWDNAATLNNATDPNPIASPTSTTTYTVTVTDGNGCVDSDQITITVDPLPDADAGADQTICLNESIAIGGSPTSTVSGATFSWDNAATLNNATDPNPLATPTATTTYTVTVTHPNGCTATDQITVTVNPLPNADAGQDQDICIGLSTVIGGNPTGPGGSTYAWDNTASLNDGTIANPTASPTITTTYTVTVTDGVGCTNTDQVTITVNPLPTADAGLDQTICEFDTVSIGSANDPNLSYAWDNAATLKDATVSDPEAFPSVSTTYTVTVTDGNGCTNTDQVTLTVLPAPFANPGNPDTLCVGESATLGGSPTGPVGATYAWDNASTLSNPNVSNPVAVPNVTTTYTVTVTGTNGCTNTGSVEIVVNPLPNVDAGQDQTICVGETATLGGSPTGPSGSTYLWDNAASLNSDTDPNPVATPTVTTTYSVTVTDVNSCTNTDQVIITVNPLPLVDAGSDQTICRTDSVAIGGSPTGPSGVTFSWSPSAGLSSTDVANPMASPDDTTTYTVTIVDGNGCSASAQVTVNVNPLPLVDFEVDQTCISDLAAFTDLSSINVGALSTWEWDFGDGVGSSNLQNPAYQYAAAGTYDVKLIVTSVIGCIDSVVKQVVINPLPLADAGPDFTLCEGNEVQLGGDPTGPTNATFSWSPGGDLDNVSIANPTASPLTTTEYYLTVVDNNGCYNYDTVEVTVNPLPNVDAGVDTIIACSFDDVALSASGAILYRWTPSTYLDDPFIANPTATVEKPITYTVEGTDANGCINTDQVHIDVMNVDFDPSDDAVCFGDSTQLQPVLGEDTVGISYNWSPSFGLNSNQVLSPKVSPPITQWYQLRIRNAAGCEDVDSILVKVDENANVSFSYVNSARCSGSVLEIENTSTNTDNFLWKVNGIARSNEFNPELGIDPSDTNVVSLLGWNQICSDSIEKKVDPATFEEILQFKGTNVFTPNNDGINDIFDPGFEGEFIGCADFRIYDRWGEKVFDSNIGQYGWDGRTLRGRRAPEGIYYYVIIVAEREIKGSIYLSR